MKDDTALRVSSVYIIEANVLVIELDCSCNKIRLLMNRAKRMDSAARDETMPIRWGIQIMIVMCTVEPM